MKRKLPKSELNLLTMQERKPVRQSDLKRLAELQLAAWMAHDEATRYAQTIAARIERGAEVEIGDYRWDQDSKMARTRQVVGE